MEGKLVPNYVENWLNIKHVIYYLCKSISIFENEVKHLAADR